MIKMVCSDLDGTLLQYGKKLIEGEIFDEIRALHDRGILFCPASGRQYTSLRKLFAPVGRRLHLPVRERARLSTAVAK